jgi:hypothetical protein
MAAVEGVSSEVPLPAVPAVCVLRVDEEAAAVNASYFETLQERLNAEKAKLDHPNYYLAVRAYDYFHAHKRELTSHHKIPVTNAWFKFVEIGVMLKRERPQLDQGRFHAFFNAELPGAAILAFSSVFGSNMTWVASSLHETDKDRLHDEYSIMRLNRKHWLMQNRNFPQQHNGDLLDVGTLCKIAEQVQQVTPKLDVYVSDAGIDVSDDYSNQERSHSILNLAQIVSGLMTVAPSGVMIIKQYTFFTPFTQSLLSALCKACAQVRIYKPQPSRITNSEVYVVCDSPDKSRFPLEAALEAVANRDLTFLADPTYNPGFLREAAHCIYEKRQIPALYKVGEILKHPAPWKVIKNPQVTAQHTPRYVEWMRSVGSLGAPQLRFKMKQHGKNKSG